MFIHPKGNPASPVWVIVDAPFEQDAKAGYVYSGSYGYIFDMMMAEAGLPNYYVIARRPHLLEHTDAYNIVENDLNSRKPPIIIPIESAGNFLVPEMGPTTRQKGLRSNIEKYAGSLLNSTLLSYAHYIIPTYGPDTIVRDWASRDIVTSVDLGRAASELAYWKTHGVHQPLPERTLRYEDIPFDELVNLLNSWKGVPMLSNDIETVYPKAKSNYYGHPGYPVTIGLAPSKDMGISFNLFRDKKSEEVELWRLLAWLLWNVPQLGQNFFNFDVNFYEMLGFRIQLEKVQDTMLRHHVLWPELPHKLQFLTRQYTREPYYKDEGKRWSLKNMTSLRKYNCKDVCTTIEVWEEQEKEFDKRPHLR
jgi:hypothetical protein